MIEDVNEIIGDVGFTNINVHKYWIPLTLTDIWRYNGFWILHLSKTCIL